VPEPGDHRAKSYRKSGNKPFATHSFSECTRF
jgi:hypothetical protein